MVWLEQEQIGPNWDRLRHAQLIAAIHNSGRVKHESNRLFVIADFLPQDPWAPPKSLPTREQHVAQMQLGLAEMEVSFGG